ITDRFQNTDVADIYAAGDVTGQRALTPVAIPAARQLVLRVSGDDPQPHLDYNCIPAVMFSHPPVGSVGYTEQEAMRLFGSEHIRVYETMFTGLYYSMTARKKSTTIKLITRLPEEKIVGLHMIGDGV